MFSINGSQTKAQVKNQDVSEVDMSVNESTFYSFLNLHLGTMVSMAVVFGAILALGIFYKLYRLKTRAARDARRRAMSGGYKVGMNLEMGPLRSQRETGLQAVFPK
jgi:hypothetical protein